MDEVRISREAPASRGDSSIKESTMKKHLTTVLLVLVLIVGLSLLLYPTFSNWWNSMHQSRAIATYAESVAELDAVQYDNIWASARAYNESLLMKPNRFYLTDEEKAEYASLMDVAGSGVMCYIEIPRLSEMMPVYHGTDEAVLQVAVGHVEGTSLPTGGAGTHCVLSGHRGLPSAKLFTNLDQLVEGDMFMLHVLDETLTYEIDQILTVLPDDVSALGIEPEMDLCTLVTCTPYGVNTHRLLVRGHRVDTVEVKTPVRLAADAVEVEMWLSAAIAVAPVALIWIIWAIAAAILRRR